MISDKKRETYTLVTNRNLSFSRLNRGEPIIAVKILGNIYHLLSLFSAIDALEKSPLKQNILKPETITAIQPNRKYSCYLPSIVSSPSASFCASCSNFNNLQDSLSAEQMQILAAVHRRCIDQNARISIIEGPPGTGKTRIISELVYKLVFDSEKRRGKRVLVCAHSCESVDEIALKLIQKKASEYKFDHFLTFPVKDNTNTECQLSF